MKFSERHGFVAASRVVQTDDMNDALRTSIWNALDEHLFSSRGFIDGSRDREAGMIEFSTYLWRDYFKKRIDSRPDYEYQMLNEIRTYFFKCRWYEVYDFTEFTVGGYPYLADEVNKMLEREMSGFRIIDGVVTPITSEDEIKAIDTALQDDDIAPAARSHLRQALLHLSNRDAPDYRNSIKESVSAVESICKVVAGKEKATLGDALGVIEKKQHLHAALKGAFAKLYGYTSDDGGIRHAMLEEPDLSLADALFFLVSCSAFINYLKDKHM